jgi:hypothetical protein
MLKLSFPTIFLALFSLNSFSQSRFQRSLNLGYESGPMLSNGTDWGNEIKEAFEYKALDIQLGWRHLESTPYNYLYRYPVLGLGFNATITHSSEIGRPLALYGFMEIPFSISARQNRVRFGYFTQLGIGFNLKPFDALRNPVNQYIGSKVNSYVHLGLNSIFRISDRMDLQTSIGLKHFSNGATKRPNSGINLFPFNLGIQFKPGVVQPFLSSRLELEEKPNRGFWNFMLYAGLKNYEIGEREFFRGGFGLAYVLESGYKYRYGLGLDFFWAQGMRLRYQDLNVSFLDQTSLAIVGTWEWQLTEKLFVPIGFGTYLYRNELNQELTWYYERLGVRYRLDNQMVVGAQIKAHGVKADFFEFTLGFTLPSYFIRKPGFK